MNIDQLIHQNGFQPKNVPFFASISLNNALLNSCSLCSPLLHWHVLKSNFHVLLGNWQDQVSYITNSPVTLVKSISFADTDKVVFGISTEQWFLIYYNFSLFSLLVRSIFSATHHGSHTFGATGLISSTGSYTNNKTFVLLDGKVKLD